jgi:plastocyanin
VPSPSPAASAQDLVQSLLDLAAVFITPDWTSLIALIPILLALLFVAWFLLTARSFASLGPRRRAPARIDPIPPAGVHMPGGSLAPALVALGAGALFAGLVIGGPALFVGVIILSITLLVWLRMAMRDYDQAESSQRLSVVVHEGSPPPGVHMPGPSTRPLLGALGSAALFAGLVFGGWVLVLSLVFLTWTLIGWLVDFTAEYRKVEEADRTGHLENIPTRPLPTRTLQSFAVVFVLVALFQLGVFPPAGPTTAGGPGASGAPGGSGAPGAPGGQGAPPGAQTVVAKDITFDVKTLEVASGQPFAIFFRNEDPPGVPHDIDIRSGGAPLKDQPHTDGGTSQTYQYEALEAGEYQFICSVHPIAAMTGTLTVK